MRTRYTLIAPVIILFIVTTALAQDAAEAPQVWMDHATCKRASFYTWDIPAYMVQSAYIEVYSPGYGGGSYVASFVTCLSVQCWYDRQFDNFVDGQVWDVTGKVKLFPAYGGAMYVTGDFIRINCQDKIYLPIVRK